MEYENTVTSVICNSLDILYVVMRIGLALSTPYAGLDYSSSGFHSKKDQTTDDAGCSTCVCVCVPEPLIT